MMATVNGAEKMEVDVNEVRREALERSVVKGDALLSKR